MPEELVTLPQTPASERLTQLLADTRASLPMDQATMTVRQGHDAQGTPRTVIALTHTDPEVVAATRQALLRACGRAKVRAFVV